MGVFFRKRKPVATMPNAWSHRFKRIAGDLFRCEICGQEIHSESDRDYIVYPEFSDPHVLTSRDGAVLLTRPIEVAVPGKPGEYIFVEPGQWRELK